ATLMPDGKVLVTGGSSGSESTNSNSSSPAYAAEMWDPATNSWTTLASNAVYRGYHSTALLLPDGRVLSAGGDFGGPNMEVFSPPYLFNGARPTISSAPESVGYGQNFFVGTPDGASITKVTWLRLASVTHTNNMNQRINRLSFSAGAGGLNVTAPSNNNLCPPGYYMLFILNGSGVPSVAKIVRLDTGAPSVMSYSPATGGAGTSVVITGINLSGATSVTFNKISATFTVGSSTQITATVPSGSTTGLIAVTTPGGTGSSANYFTGAPSISSFTPASGGVGASVVISGINLSPQWGASQTTVTFNGTSATAFTVNSSSQITATVPSGATTGPIAVTTPGGTATSANSFTVIPAPTITSFSPTSGGMGTSVVITGTDLMGATS